MQTNNAQLCSAAVRVKHWVLRHYLWVALSLLLLALATGLAARLQDWKIWLTVVGVPFSLLLTTQKQKTEELKLFTKLFREFNQRYDSLHHDLNAIAAKKTLLQTDKDVLFKYFNLCGEEYLYFVQGYIYPEVWDAWYNGMKRFRKDSRKIKELWDEELADDSYYGLHFEDQARVSELGASSAPEEVGGVSEPPPTAVPNEGQPVNAPTLGGCKHTLTQKQ
jgi:hypothetical protein